MKVIKNSCGRRGCNVRILLPIDCKPKPVLSRVYGVGNDFAKVLPLLGLSLDKMAKAA